MDKFETLINVIMKPTKKRSFEDIEIISTLLDTIKFFNDRNLTHKDLRCVSEALTHLYLEPNENVIEYNSFGDTFYIILEGNVSVLIPKKVENEEGKIETIFNNVATLGPGKSFGELALINNARRLVYCNRIEMQR